MSILSSFGYLENEAKVFFDRLDKVLLTSQPIRLAKINTFRYEIQYLQDHLLELKEQEKAYFTNNNILSDDLSNSSKFETLPEFTVDNKASFYLFYQPKNILDNEIVAKTDGINYTEPEIDKYKQDVIDKVSDVDKYVRFWNQKIKYTRLLIEKRFTLLKTLIEEEEGRTNG